MKMMVTGAAGFIGTHLARSLAEAGHDMVAVDISEFHPDLQKAETISCVTADIRDESKMAEAMVGVNVVFHQAAMASVPESFANPAKCMDINVVGSTVVFEQARLAGVNRVVMASTSAIYGDDPTPVKNEGLTPAPRSPYAVSKLAMEQLADVYARQYGMEMVALRYFNVYGPGQPAEGGYAAVIPAIRKAVETKQPMVVYGDGEQTRSFIYVDDVVRANKLASTMDLQNTSTFFVGNLATDEVISINDLLRVAEDVIGGVVPIETRPEREGDIKHSAGDTALLKKKLGFAAEIPLSEGMRHLLGGLKF